MPGWVRAADVELVARNELHLQEYKEEQETRGQWAHGPFMQVHARSNLPFFPNRRHERLLQLESEYSHYPLEGDSQQLDSMHH